jgi:pSer/pThr/pTyr-binding forkhead associated (FHA) protein
MTGNVTTDLFLEACSATGTLQVQMECQGKPAAEKIVPLPFIVVGRDEGCDLVLDDDQVSLRHAFFQVVGGRLFGVDLRSRTGTFWPNGAKASGWVDPGQSIRIGPYVLHFYDYGFEKFPPPESDFDPLASPVTDRESMLEVTLEFVSGPARPLTWGINRVLTLIGRSNDCGVCLRDTSVSAFHGALLRAPEGTWIIDLLGRGGIALNGRRVRWGRLNPGDQLQVGNFVLRFRPISSSNGSTTSHGAVPGINGYAERSHDDARLFTAFGANETQGIVSNSNAGGPAYALTPALDRAGINETIVMPLVNQFAMLQNDMFAKFQESILMMVDMFSRMHREQMGVIRTEVDRLHDLTEELQALQAELTRRQAPAPAAAGAAPATPAMENEPAAPVVTGVSNVSGVSDPGLQSVQLPAPAAVAVPEPKPAKPPAYSFTPAPKEPPLELPQPKETTTDGDVHLWLYQRINALQHERQSILKKLYKFVVGK